MANSSSRADLELLHGAIDIHIHHGPDLYPRIQDPIELATEARAAGFRAICIKRHNFPTPGLAALASKLVSDIDVFGSIALNFEVGGVNPIAVEAALKYGARQVWLPTIDSTNHARVTGAVGQHGKGLTIKGGISDYARNKPRMDLVDADGRFIEGLREVIELVADADVILNLGHTSFAEQAAVIDQAKKQGVKRMVSDHPFFTRFSLDQQVELADRGAIVNYTAGELFPRWWRVSVGDFAAAIRKVGVQRAVISSDCGQLHNPPMVEALRMACQLLLEEGFAPDEIRQMLHHNPAALLYP